jgi:hypothetical protein
MSGEMYFSLDKPSCGMYIHQRLKRTFQENSQMAPSKKLATNQFAEELSSAEALEELNRVLRRAIEVLDEDGADCKIRGIDFQDCMEIGSMATVTVGLVIRLQRPADKPRRARSKA